MRILIISVLIFYAHLSYGQQRKSEDTGATPVKESYHSRYGKLKSTPVMKDERKQRLEKVNNVEKQHDSVFYKSKQVGIKTEE